MYKEIALYCIKWVQANKEGKFNFIEIEKYAIILARKLKISYKGHYKPLIISGIIYEYIYFRHNSS